ncbi:V-type ATP synthase subunit C [Ferroglobus sp.]|uniref:V-type ATP synthase subunit C n=1 Tax=Ferroglobus sp. TaxID=2614230 RepID=UPI0025C329F8|nr:V-type ATP synthase subunit C [Ferroglobus sp.]
MLRKIIRKPRAAEWAYIVARVRVMKRKLIPKDEYNKLLNMDLNEIIRYLEESEYKNEINELAIRYSGVELLDYALYLNLTRTYRKLVRISKGLPREMIVDYLRKWDFWNLKNIIRGKMFGFPKEEIEKTLVPAGEFDEEFWKMLLARESVEDIIKEFAKKPYYPILEELARACPISEFEDRLDKFYYTSLASIHSDNIDIMYFVDFIRMEIDIKNVKTLLRLKLEGASPEEIAAKIIPKGYQLSESELRKLAAMDYEDMLKNLENYWFSEAVKQIKDQPLSKIEVFFDKVWAKRVLSRANHFPLSILPVLAFILMKKIEVDNLRIIARGKAEGMSAEEIKEQLVVV